MVLGSPNAAIRRLRSCVAATDNSVASLELLVLGTEACSVAVVVGECLGRGPAVGCWWCGFQPVPTATLVDYQRKNQGKRVNDLLVCESLRGFRVKARVRLG